MEDLRRALYIMYNPGAAIGDTPSPETRVPFYFVHMATVFSVPLGSRSMAPSPLLVREGTLISGKSSAGEVVAGEHRAADEFLQKFLYSPSCWVLSLALLRAGDATPAEHLFCARALHVRLRCSVAKAEKRQAPSQLLVRSGI